MPSTRFVTLAAALSLAACTGGGPGPYNETPSLGATKAFSATVGGLPPVKSVYGNRLGPTRSPWSDSSKELAVPPKPGPAITTKVASGTVGPEVLVDSLAVSVGALGGSGTVTVATDLDTGAEKWRLPANQSFDPGLVVSDGTLVCGIQGGSGTAATAQCLTLATGAPVWSKPLGRSVSLVPGYGWPTELRLHGDALFVLGLGKLDVLALADGSPRYSLSVTHVGQGLAFVGDDLVLSGVTSGCASGASCLRAVSPATGATVAESPTPRAAFLWATGTKANYLANPPGGARSIVTYDASTHTFGEDAALLAALTDTIGSNTRQTLFGLTPVLSDGRVYLGLGDASTSDDTTVPGGVCRYSVTAKKREWCANFGLRPSSVRVHPNAVFVDLGAGYFGAGRTVVLSTDTGLAGASAFGFYFGKWAFSPESVNVIH